MKPQAFATAILIGFAGIVLAATDPATPEQQQMRFQAMDENRDGRISRSEWRGSGHNGGGATIRPDGR